MNPTQLPPTVYLLIPVLLYLALLGLFLIGVPLLVVQCLRWLFTDSTTTQHPNNKAHDNELRHTEERDVLEGAKSLRTGK